ELGKVLHFDLYGKREFKYDFLNENSIQSIYFNELPNVAPMYFMVQKDFEAKATYDKGIKISDLFVINSVGVVTAREDITITFDKKYLSDIIDDFKSLEIDSLRVKYNLPKDTRDWKIKYAVSDLIN